MSVLYTSNFASYYLEFLDYIVSTYGVILYYKCKVYF